MLDTPIGWGLLFLVGIFTGTLSGLLGIGGGLLLVPALTVWGVPLIQATATSLIGVFLSALSGSIRNWRAGELNWRSSLLLAVFGIVTAQAGALLGDRLPEAGLALGFAALLLITVYLMDLRHKLKKRQESKPDSPQLEESSDPVLPKETSFQFASVPVPQIAVIGLLAGALSGLFGVGGGVVMVPLQMLFLGEAIKAAVRTSLGAIVPIAISGLAQHAWNGNVLWVPGLFLGLGGITGAQLGTRLLPRLPDRTVNTLFRALLFALAAYMIFQAIRSWG
ncbi:MAG TPA: sulfite exporter TauE/SafE family protein [Elainellaceae cyanobacterium]